MTRKDFSGYYSHLFGLHAPFRGRFWKSHRELLMCMDFLEFGFAFSNFDVYSLAEEKDKTQFATKTNWLGNCEATTPLPPVCIDPDCMGCDFPKQKQGNNPMRIETTNATAYVTSTKSDDAISRDYLLSRLSQFDSWRDTKPGELQKLFNIDGPTTPTTTQGLIDAIKNDKFKLDDKKLACIKDAAEDQGVTPEEYADEYGYGYGPLSYIIFTDLPKADRKGYDEALKEYGKQKIATKDIIMTAPPADGLKALQALEAWLPVGKAN